MQPGMQLARHCGPDGFPRVACLQRGGRASREDEARFEEAKRRAERARHPNIVSTLDLTRTRGELCVVMEYAPGLTLAVLVEIARARGTRVPHSILTAVMADVLHGLHAAHEARESDGQPLALAHGDVSAHSIVVGADGIARVCGFGVTEARGERAACADDIRAAAVVLAEALAGAPAQSLEAIVQRGLAHDTRDGYATARQMALALEDAGDPARPSELRGWLQTFAAAELAVQAETAHALENGMHDNPLEEAVHARTSASRYALPAQRSSRHTSIALAALFLIGAAAGLVVSRRMPSEPLHAPDIRAATPLAPAIELRAEPASFPQIAIVPSAEPLASSRPAPPPPGVRPIIPRPATAKNVHAVAPPAASAPATDKCDPPFVFDKEGVAIFRPECL